MLVIAFILATLLASREAKRHNIPPDLIFNACFGSFVSGIIGARLLFILQNLGFYLKNPLEMIMLQHGGLSWYGGLAFGLIFGLVFLKVNKADILKTLDVVAPHLALAQAIGRIGCLLNGCCAGTVIHNKIPVQVVGSLLLLLMFFMLRLKLRGRHLSGQVIFTYLFFYSLKRFIIEFYRTDNPSVFLHFTLFHIISAGLFVFSLATLIILKSRKT
jgi:phosphatidylglycerol:prolipoprotein diacylglycerol transferase